MPPGGVSLFQMRKRAGAAIGGFPAGFRDCRRGRARVGPGLVTDCFRHLESGIQFKVELTTARILPQSCATLPGSVRGRAPIGAKQRLWCGLADHRPRPPAPAANRARGAGANHSARTGGSGPRRGGGAKSDRGRIAPRGAWPGPAHPCAACIRPGRGQRRECPRRRARPSPPPQQNGNRRPKGAALSPNT